jgi:hypothetical protein
MNRDPTTMEGVVGWQCPAKRVSGTDATFGLPGVHRLGQCVRVARTLSSVIQVPGARENERSSIVASPLLSEKHGFQRYDRP